MRIQRVVLSPDRRQSGFAIVAILLLVGLIATVSATYLKHVVVENQQSISMSGALDASAAVQSGLQFAKQSIVTGTSTVSEISVSTGEQTATLQVVGLSDGRARCDLQSLDSNGLGTTLLAEAARVPKARESYEHPDELPRLWADTVSDLLADTSIPKHYYDGQVTLEDTELFGLVVVEDTSALTLRDVVITGAIVSARTLVDAPFGDFDGNTVPCLFMDGNTRIQPASFLPGVAVVMPDGVFATWTEDARIHIEGDVVAHTVTLNRPGTFVGNLACIGALTVHADLDRPGLLRKPLPWSEAFDMKGSWDNEFMAFLPRYSTLAELQPIREYWADFQHTQLSQPQLVTKTTSGSSSGGGSSSGSSSTASGSSSAGSPSTSGTTTATTGTGGTTGTGTGGTTGTAGTGGTTGTGGLGGLIGGVLETVEDVVDDVTGSGSDSGSDSDSGSGSGSGSDSDSDSDSGSGSGSGSSNSGSGGGG